MGCDIHCYIEYKSPDTDGWSDFGRINPGRNYDLFGKLAGVRRIEVTPVVEPRGLPEDVAYAASSDAWLFVTDTGSSEGCCSREQAEQWVGWGARYRNSEKEFVSNPDWHSHSWLTPNEFAIAIEGSGEPEYEAILAAMRSFEAGGFQARVVFWFDN